MVKLGPEPADIALARRIRDRRQAIGLSQEDVAALLGVSFQQVQKYEKGTNKLSFGKLVRIARALNTTFAALADGLIDERIAQDVIRTTPMIDSKARRVSDLYNQIEDVGIRNSLFALLQQLSKNGENEAVDG